MLPCCFLRSSVAILAVCENLTDAEWVLPCIAECSQRDNTSPWKPTLAIHALARLLQGRRLTLVGDSVLNQYFMQLSFRLAHALHATGDASRAACGHLNATADDTTVGFHVHEYSTGSVSLAMILYHDGNAWQMHRGDGIKRRVTKGRTLPILLRAAQWSDVVLVAAGVHFQLHKPHDELYDAWARDVESACAANGAVERSGSQCVLMDTPPQHFPNTIDGTYRSCGQRPSLVNRTRQEEALLRECQRQHTQPLQGPVCLPAQDSAAQLRLYSKSRLVGSRANITSAKTLEGLVPIADQHVGVMPSSRASEEYVMDCTHYCPNAEHVWDLHDQALAHALLELEQAGRLPRHCMKHAGVVSICKSAK